MPGQTSQSGKRVPCPHCGTINTVSIRVARYYYEGYKSYIPQYMADNTQGTKKPPARPRCTSCQQFLI